MAESKVNRALWMRNQFGQVRKELIVLTRLTRHGTEWDLRALPRRCPHGLY